MPSGIYRASSGKRNKVKCRVCLSEVLLQNYQVHLQRHHPGEKPNDFVLLASPRLSPSSSEGKINLEERGLETMMKQLNPVAQMTLVMTLFIRTGTSRRWHWKV